jgi:NAD(P)-dependent dehydrogenase (short-subunit alcohol dehydrogenase family)
MKKAIVIGSTSGIGKGLAKTFAAKLIAENDVVGGRAI